MVITPAALPAHPPSSSVRVRSLSFGRRDPFRGCARQYAPVVIRFLSASVSKSTRGTPAKPRARHPFLACPPPLPLLILHDYRVCSLGRAKAAGYEKNGEGEDKGKRASSSLSALRVWAERGEKTPGPLRPRPLTVGGEGSSGSPHPRGVFLRGEAEFSTEAFGRTQPGRI